MPKTRTMNRSLATLAGAALLAGCTVGPNYKEPEMKVPGDYGNYATPAATVAPATQPAPAAAATQPSTRPALPVTNAWWNTFNDPMLDRLIEEAAAQSLPLRAAAARVVQARALRGVAAAAWWPTVDGSGSYTRSKGSKTVNRGGISVGPGGTVSGAGAETDFWQAGFDASWEIDVFGGIRRSVEAATADVEATIADRNDVLLTLLGDVARNYMELRGAQREVAIAQENVVAQRQTLELTRAKLAAGLTSDLDVARSEAQVTATESTIPRLQAAVAQSIHQLSILLAKAPNELETELGQPQPIPLPPPQVPMGLPRDLLRRRPDIRRAERNLAAATARVGVATAQLYPRFTLSGSLGQQSTKFTNLFDSASTFWSLGPGFTVPIFNAGSIRSNIAAEKAFAEESLANYQQTVLNALAEVEDTLVAYQKEFVRRESLAASVAANQRAVSLSQQLYQRGLTNFLDVLDSQRALFTSQDALAQSDAQVSANAVALLKALGGGWDERSVNPQ
jgi:NodT family efflux transporter outer membrane factor (OMF) lipoprotein